MSTKDHSTVISLAVIVPAEWIDYVTSWTDGFHRHVYGYWAHPIERTAEGWRVAIGDDGSEEIVFNESVAVKAYIEGVKRFGLDWYTNADGSKYDTVMQFALFGKEVFG